MNMLSNKIGEEYAEALKDALKMKRDGTIPPAIDTELGHLLYSVTQWALSEAVTAGQLWRTFSQDDDFQSDVLCAVVNYSNKVDLERNPKEILIYLKKIGRSAIRDKLKYLNRGKRQREETGLDGVVIETDFYGERCGTAYSLDDSTKEFEN